MRLRRSVSVAGLCGVTIILTGLYAAGSASHLNPAIIPNAPSLNASTVTILSAQKKTPNASKACSRSEAGARERYHLPPPKNLPPGISFTTDWAHNPTGGWFGEQIVDNCRMQVDGFLTWHDKPAVRVEVQPKDDPLVLHANSERAEMLYMQDSNGVPIQENRRSGIQYYATSYYFPPSWHGEQLRWSAFSPLDCSADDGNRCNSWSFVLQLYGWGGLSAAATAVGGPQHYMFNGAPFLDGGRIALGKWTDFVFEVDWRTGKHTIWRRDEGTTKFNRVLTSVTPVPSGEIYFKQGLYRGGTVNGRTDVFWIGPTSRGSSFTNVEKQSFGTESGPS
jgi:hypothetical protein